MDQYRTAAAEGAIVELKLRLLADKIPALQQYAHQQNLEDVETAIAQHFGAALPETDKEKLRVCRQLRNKILHCNFSAAREKLEELGTANQRGGVNNIKVAGLSSARVAEKLLSAKANIAGIFESVADTRTTDPGSVFGWLLEAGNAGDFQHAAEAFKSAAGIIERLSNTNEGNAGA